MANLAWLWLPMVVTHISGKAVLDLAGEQVVNGTWKAAVTLPCVYEPSAGFTELSVTWKAFEQGHGVRNIFIRDESSGDQTLVTTFKSRLKVNRQPPGDVSLRLDELAMTDAGPYICRVLWAARNKSRVAKWMTTTLRVVKVPVSKPTIQSSPKEPLLPKGSRASLTCSANGSPPIQYQWYKEVPGDRPGYVTSGPELAFDHLQASDAGRYYCSVSNRVSRQTGKSDVVELRVNEDVLPLPTKEPRKLFKPRTTTGRGPRTAWSTTEAHGYRLGREASRQASFPLYLIILIVVLGVTVLLVIVSVIFCRRRTKTDSSTYDVAFHNNGTDVTAGTPTPASPEPCACKFEQAMPGGGVEENLYTKGPTTQSHDYVAMQTQPDNEYESLVNQMESEYEVAGAK